MRKFKTKSSVFLIAVLLISLVMPTQLSFAASINTGNEIDYNDEVPSSSATPVEVAPDLTITAGQGELFSGGNLKFEIASGSDTSEKLILPDGDYTIDGQNVKVDNGVISIDGNQVGSVNNSLDGDGKALQIDFDVIPVQNGNFEDGLDAQGNPVGWTINTTTTVGSNTYNQIILQVENLATKTQGNPYSNIQDIGNGQYRVTGNGYSYVTDVDYGTLKTNDGATTFREGRESLFQSGREGTLVNELADDKGNKSLKIGFDGGWVDTQSGYIGTIFRADAWSPKFTAKQGDQLGFDWLAQGGDDDYEVYGFIVDSNGNHTELMYGRGKDQPWTTETGIIPADGEYQFRFVSGSFDRTDGKGLGAILQIDNIRVLNGKLTNDFAQALGKLVKYETTKPLGDRNINISVTNGVGGTSNVAQVPVLMGDVLGDSLSITSPAQDDDVYDENPTIKGKVLPGADVSVTLTGPNGYTSTATTTADADGNWSIAVPDSLTAGGAGDYLVEAEATYPNYSPITDDTDFTFIDKSKLDYLVNVVVPDLNEDDYRAGWDGLNNPLTFADMVLNDSNPTQANINNRLSDLQAAIDALEKHEPNAEKITFYDGQKDLIVDFDKAITEDDNQLDLTDGFTVLVDGVEVDVDTAEIIGNDGDQLKLTLVDGTELSSDANIEVIYKKDEGNSNIVGDEDHGTAVEDFKLEASDPFGKALQIEQPEGITNDTKPTISGTVDPDADSTTITLIGPNGQETIIDEEDLTINPDGTWSYDVDETLAPGDYEVEVTTSKGGRPDVTKSETFTVVDKSDLDNYIANIINDLDEGDYRAGWGDLTDAVNTANDLLNNPNATQDDIDAALQALEDAKKALEKHEPKVEDATFYDGEDEIIVDFDKPITEDDSQLDLTDGFTVLVDGEEVDVELAEIIGNGVQVKLTLADGTKLSSDADVIIIYDEDDGDSNIVGDEDNGTPVESFMFVGGDPFGKAFQIESPEGITNNTSPTISGTVDPDADSMVVTLIGPNGQETIIDEEDLTINPDGTWSYDVDKTLAPGDYEVIVTTTKAGRPDVTKSQTFTMVDKEDLNKTTDNLIDDDLIEGDYTKDTWKAFASTLRDAQSILSDPDATQEEVDRVHGSLIDAYNKLVYRGDLAKEVDVADDLNPSHYSKTSWAAYKAALNDALSVFNDPNATQDEIDAAKKALEKARDGLTVDKSHLKKGVANSDNLDEPDYTKRSWKAYQKALDEANRVLFDPSATQAEVDAALTALEQAEGSLKEDKGSMLPSTATNMYMYGLVGGLLLLLGLALVYTTRKKKMN